MQNRVKGKFNIYMNRPTASLVLQKLKKLDKIKYNPMKCKKKSIRKYYCEVTKNKQVYCIGISSLLNKYRKNTRKTKLQKYNKK